jgi:hypothetical protein
MIILEHLLLFIQVFLYMAIDPIPRCVKEEKAIQQVESRISNTAGKSHDPSLGNYCASLQLV